MGDIEGAREGGTDGGRAEWRERRRGGWAGIEGGEGGKEGRERREGGRYRGRE